jgi:glutamyl/glutaminyl-tRNA synthetase
VNAVFVWGLARALGGRVLVRIEDHDRGRSRAEFERALLDDLDWLGLARDGGPGIEEGELVIRQSERNHVYDDALASIIRRDPTLVYACVCTRRDIAGAVVGETGQETRYPGTCRARAIDAGVTPARRVVMLPGEETFDDVALGAQRQDPSAQCGDVLVRDRRGWWTYQFAASVDDHAQAVDVVIRGADLLESTARQIRLGRLLGRAVPPVFLHHPLLTHPDGSKLSKSAGDTGIRELRDAGWSPARVLGEAAARAGLLETAVDIEGAELGWLFK